MVTNQAPEATSNNPTYVELLSRAVVAMRIERGVNRRDLANRSGVSYTYLSQLETGVRTWNVRTLVQIAEGMGVTPSALLLRAETIAASLSFVLEPY